MISPCLHRLVVVHGLDAENVHLLHLLAMASAWWGQLGAVLPVDLIAVVLLGVVAGGDVDAGDAAVFPDGEGQLGRGAQGLKDAHGDAVARHDAGGARANSWSGCGSRSRSPRPAWPPPLGQNDLGEGLGGVADDMDVHLVQAHAHGAPQTGGAELQRGRKNRLSISFSSPLRAAPPPRPRRRRAVDHFSISYVA